MTQERELTLESALAQADVDAAESNSIVADLKRIDELIAEGNAENA